LLAGLSEQENPLIRFRTSNFSLLRESHIPTVQFTGVNPTLIEIRT